MAEFEVTLPVHGVIYMTVEANSAEEAIQLALETYDEQDLSEWSAVESFGQGNVTYVSPTEAIAEKVRGWDE